MFSGWLRSLGGLGLFFDDTIMQISLEILDLVIWLVDGLCFCL